MGGNSSKSTVEQTNEFFNSSTKSFMSSLTQNVRAVGTVKQSINLSDTEFTNCRVSAAQTNVQNLTAEGQLRSEDSINLASSLANSANTAIDNSASQHNGFLAPAVANSADARTTLKNKVTNIINTTISKSTVQDIIATGLNNQDNNVHGMKATCNPAYRAPGEFDFVFDQNITQSITAKGIADAITAALVADSSVTSAVTGVTQHADQSNAGVDDLVKAITGMWGMISGVVLAIVCIVLIVMLGGKGGGKGGGGANTATLAALLKK